MSDLDNHKKRADTQVRSYSVATIKPKEEISMNEQQQPDQEAIRKTENTDGTEEPREMDRRQAPTLSGITDMIFLVKFAYSEANLFRTCTFTA